MVSAWMAWSSRGGMGGRESPNIGDTLLPTVCIFLGDIPPVTLLRTYSEAKYAPDRRYLAVCCRRWCVLEGWAQAGTNGCSWKPRTAGLRNGLGVLVAAAHTSCRVWRKLYESPPRLVHSHPIPSAPVQRNPDSSSRTPSPASPIHNPLGAVPRRFHSPFSSPWTEQT